MLYEVITTPMEILKERYPQLRTRFALRPTDPIADLTLTVHRGLYVRVITSYSIHYTKLYEGEGSDSCVHGGSSWTLCGTREKPSPPGATERSIPSRERSQDGRGPARRRSRSPYRGWQSIPNCRESRGELMVKV